MALLTRELVASYAFIERNFFLTKRYWGWEIAWLVYATASALAIAFIGVDQGDQRLVLMLMIGAALILVGLGFHAFVTLPALLYLFTRRNPYRFFWQMSQALLTAFSTASSSATLPVTMEVAEEKLDIEKEVSSFVLPLGATINMDGTALYQAVATMFIAQVLIGDISLTAQFAIVLTATLASIGAAGVPSAGIIILVVVLEQALAGTGVAP